MRVETRNVYVSDDGSEFDSEEACLHHERVEVIAKYLDNHRRVYLHRESSTASEIITALLEKYDIQERKPS